MILSALPAEAAPLLLALAPAFTTPTFRRFQLLLVTAVLTEKAPPREQVVASLEQAGVVVEPGVIPEALRLRKTGDIAELEAHLQGWIRIQDETAKLIGDALAPPPGARVLDLCAAPGSKAAQLLQMVGPTGHVVACDADPQKLPRLRDSLGRVGDNFTVRQVPADPERLSFDETFSHILVDVPCSNTGVLGKRPEARWRITADGIAELAALQKKLLSAAAARLVPGGRLVYSTCSIEIEENEAVVRAALAAHPQLHLQAEQSFQPGLPGDGAYQALLVHGP